MKRNTDMKTKLPSLSLEAFLKISIWTQVFVSKKIPDKKQAAIEEDESCLGRHREELSAIITSPGAPRDEGCHQDHPGTTQQEESSVTFSLLRCSIKTKMKLLNKNSVKPKSLI